MFERYRPELRILDYMHYPGGERRARTRLVANPAGYGSEKKARFDPALVIDLEEATA